MEMVLIIYDFKTHVERICWLIISSMYNPNVIYMNWHIFCTSTLSSYIFWNSLCIIFLKVLINVNLWQPRARKITWVYIIYMHRHVHFMLNGCKIRLVRNTCWKFSLLALQRLAQQGILSMGKFQEKTIT